MDALILILFWLLMFAYLIGSVTGMILWREQTKNQVKRLQAEVDSLRLIRPTDVSDTMIVDAPIPESHPNSRTSVERLIQDIRPEVAFR